LGGESFELEVFEGRMFDGDLYIAGPEKDNFLGVAKDSMDLQKQKNELNIPHSRSIALRLKSLSPGIVHEALRRQIRSLDQGVLKRASAA
jgi:hypothetical protein